MKDWLVLIGIGGMILLIPFFIIWSVTLGYGNEKIETISNVNAEIQIKNSASATKRDKLVFSDEDIYQVEDRFWSFHFNSMSVFNDLRQNNGKECEVRVSGTRVGLFSMYRNITEVISCK